MKEIQYHHHLPLSRNFVFEQTARTLSYILLKRPLKTPKNTTQQSTHRCTRSEASPFSRKTISSSSSSRRTVHGENFHGIETTASGRVVSRAAVRAMFSRAELVEFLVGLAAPAPGNGYIRRRGVGRLKKNSSENKLQSMISTRGA